jgi:hypothetical protein
VLDSLQLCLDLEINLNVRGIVLGKFGKLLVAAAVVALTPFAALAATVNGTGNVSPNVIFGGSVSNGSFTGATAGGVELALRGKLRYDLDGQPQNTFNFDNVDTYTFMSANSVAPSNRSIFNFEWAIHTLGGAALNSLTYLLTVDTDPTVNNNSAISYNPMAALLYLGTDASGQGSATEVVGPNSNLANFTVAQQSVNMGFLTAPFAPIPVPLGSGKFTFTLSAFSGQSMVNSTTMHVVVDAPAAVPLPAGGLLLIGALGGLAGLRRRAKSA